MAQSAELPYLEADLARKLEVAAVRRDSTPEEFRDEHLAVTVDEAVEAADRIGADRTWFIHMTHDIEHADLDSRLPEGMALAYTELFIVRADAVKERYIKRMCELFGVDGIVFHDAKTCPNNSNTRYGLPQRLRERTGVPFTIVYGDLNDLRMISDEQTKTNVEAFIEQLEENR